MSVLRSEDPRYVTLEGWRGLASIMVCLGHLFGNSTLRLGLGVQLFFVISGYCMSVATEKAVVRGMSIRTFATRRIRRIAPPYLASLALTVIVGFLVDFRDKGLSGAVEGVSHPAVWYLQNATLTQWTTVTRAYVRGWPYYPVSWINPRLAQGPYWSLCYEEQFYAFLGLLVLIAAGRRARLVALIFAATVGISLWNASSPGAITGLLPDYWAQFACGIALFYRLTFPVSRGRGRALNVVLGVGVAWLLLEARVRGELGFRPFMLEFTGELALCASFALLLLVLRPFDAVIARSGPARALGVVGGFSYSLYLVNLPVLVGLAPAREALEEQIGLRGTQAISFGAVLLFAFSFHRVFERPFLNKPEPVSPPCAARASEPAAAPPPRPGA